MIQIIFNWPHQLKKTSRLVKPKNCSVPFLIYQTRPYSVNYKSGKMYLQMYMRLAGVNAWERKTLCFSSSHGPSGHCMVFPIIPASPARWAAWAGGTPGWPYQHWVFPTTQGVLPLSGMELHLPFCGEVLLLEDQHWGLICELKTLPCEGAPALRRFFIPRSYRCPLNRRTHSRCLVRLCKL